jgi:amino acid transporter/nucleotide-binding universal stress UspA family protein
VSEPAQLRRELGFWDALTIGVGTMIGAGIFLLAGVALELTGPAAIFAYLFAGAVCMITAMCTAELATGMSTSGGDYYFVSRSMGPAFGAISGIGIWLSLTFAISFYLFGLGEYLSRMLPITPFIGAVLGGVLITVLNVIGAKVSGRAQVGIVLVLMVILVGFAVSGLFFIEVDNFTPFFPFGAAPILSTTALVFVSFLGFVKIAAVAEEIQDPGKNLPRTLIGSVALVTVLYVVILLVVAGMFPQRVIGQVHDPLTEAARRILGSPGGMAIIFAGLLATLSSANASIMAASRINLAMARDGMITSWFSRIHQKLLTPHRAILVTSVLALGFLFVESLEDLAKFASVLQLYSYAALNIGCVILRGAGPDWYRPSYRAPGFPLLPIIAAVCCIGIILSSGGLAIAAVITLILFSLTWYFVRARPRVAIEHAGTAFRSRLNQLGLRVFFVPVVSYETAAGAEEVRRPRIRALEPNSPRYVIAAVGNPEHESDILRLGRHIATGADAGGRVSAIHFVSVPLQTPLSTAREQFKDRQQPHLQRTIADLAARAEREAAADVAEGRHTTSRPLAETTIEGTSDVAHDVFASIASEPTRAGGDLLIMGWKGRFSGGRIAQSPLQGIMSDVEVDLAVLRPRGLGVLQSILLPWGGGPHAQLGLEIAIRIADSTGARVDLLRVTREEVDPDKEAEELRASIHPIAGDTDRIRVRVRHGESVMDGIDAVLSEESYDLVIVGASRESRLRQVLFGSIPDRVADLAECSVLLVRHALPPHWSGDVGDRMKSWKEQMGWTSSAASPEAKPDRLRDRSRTVGGGRPAEPEEDS